MRLSSLLPFLKENITFAATLLSKFIDLFIFSSWSSVEKYSFSLKTLLQQGVSEPEF